MQNKSVSDSGDGTIIRDTFVPYYIQLKEILKPKILDGTWQPGELLPSEADLGQTYNVSRTVVRQALGELQQEGLIYRHKGKGTYVSEPKVRETLIQGLTGFYQDMIAQGHEVTNHVLRQEVIKANMEIASYLDIPPETPVVVCERLRFVDGKPINFSISYIPQERCPDVLNADLTNQSLHTFIQQTTGREIVRGRRIIEATLATEQTAKLLEVDADLPLFMLLSIYYLDDGTPIELSRGYHRSDRSLFEVELVRAQQLGQRDVSTLDLTQASIPRSFKMQE